MSTNTDNTKIMGSEYIFTYLTNGVRVHFFDLSVLDEKCMTTLQYLA
ncbi:hypothetical protein ALT1000_520018 [Alteromonas macleodii]